MSKKMLAALLCFIGISGAFGYYTINSLHQALNQLAEEHQKLEQNFKELVALEKPDGPLLDLEQTLQLINQQLKFGGNSKVALEMLETVEEKLLEPEFEAYTTLKIAVHADLEQLRLNPGIDKAALWFRLQQVTAQLQPELSSLPEEESSDRSWKNAFRGLVSIHKRDDRSLGNDLFPLLYIEQAMWAVLYDQSKIYEQSLFEAMKMLEPVLQFPHNQGLKDELVDLMSVRLPSGIGTVDQSLHVLIEILQEESPHV